MQAYEHSAFKLVKPGTLHGKIEVPTSKSVANRLLILAAIFPDEWRLRNMSDSSDVITMIQCLKKVGLNILESGQDILIRNSFPACETKQSEPVDLHTGDGGTTNRFLAALLAKGHNTYRLHPSEKMTERPMDELIEALKILGVYASRDEMGVLTIRGPIVPVKQVQVDCSRSTQFATGLALALADTPTLVMPIKMENSEKYFGMTKTLIERAKKGIRDHLVTADGSGIGYPLALACFGGEVTLLNVHEVDPDQADFAIIDLLKKMGANIQWTEQGLTLIGDRPLKSFEADASIYPDLMLTLSFLAAYANGTSVLKKLEVLRHKESDRLEEILALLKQFKIEHAYNAKEDELTIIGSSKQVGRLDLEPPVDHRVVMVSYLFLRKNKGGKLFHPHAVEKSFPTFYKVMEG